MVSFFLQAKSVGISDLLTSVYPIFKPTLLAEIPEQLINFNVNTK